jgi:hypothetical protein
LTHTHTHTNNIDTHTHTQASIKPAKEETIIGVPKPYIVTNQLVVGFDPNVLLYENAPLEEVDEEEEFFEMSRRRR